MEREVRAEPDKTERPVRSGTTPDNSGSDVAPYARMPSVRISAVVALAIAAGVEECAELHFEPFSPPSQNTA
jgi:hypothetical protein